MTDAMRVAICYGRKSSVALLPQVALDLQLAGYAAALHGADPEVNSDDGTDVPRNNCMCYLRTAGAAHSCPRPTPPPSVA